MYRVKKPPEQRHRFANLFQCQNARVQPVIQIRGQVGNLVRQVDQLRLQRRPLIEKILPQLRMLRRRVVARVLDDPFAHRQRQVQPAKRCVAFLKPRDNTQRVQVVVEPEAVSAERAVQRLLAGMAKRRVADVMHQRQRLRQRAVQAQRRGQRARNLRHLQRVRQAAAEVVAGAVARQARKHLGLAGQAPERARMQHPRAIPRKRRAVGVRRLRISAAGKVARVGHGNGRRQHKRAL